MSHTINRVLMCHPDHYDVTYEINPWMKPGTVDRKKAKVQWKTLVKTYSDLGIKVETINQASHSPDMVFSTDSGISYKGRVLMSNFMYPQRQKEWMTYAQWFEEHGFDTTYLPHHYAFEGGDCLFWNDTLFIGFGFRTTQSACKYISQKLRVPVVPLELINHDFYHLDTCLLFVDKYTAFYYPEAFHPESRKLLDQYVPYLFPFTEKEAFSFAANSVVTKKHIILSQANPSFSRKIKRLGFKPLELDMSEFLKSGGGVHCLTHIIN